MATRFRFVAASWLILSLIVTPIWKVQAGNASLPIWHILRPQTSGIISPEVQRQLAQAQAEQAVTVIVRLKQEADIAHGNDLKREERLTRVIEALTVTADRTQGPIKKFLKERQRKGTIREFTSFWIFNGFSVTATPAAIREIAAQPDVLSITPDALNIVPAIAPPVLDNPEPNINLINAPALWSMGYTGDGVVIASMDTGVSLSQPDLAAQWRGGTNSWFDPYGNYTSPTDLDGHGTWIMGIMVGGNTGGTDIGVAPSAQWIAVKMFDDQMLTTATAIHAGYQWLLDPDGDPTTADAPQVVNNSWAYGTPGCFLEFEPDLQALRAAGILAIFAAGNGGPSVNTSYSPANNPSAFAVGATNNSDMIYGLSSRGPSSCGGSTGVFPELTAPGVAINTTDLGGFFTSATGTSISAPHVTGGLALLLSAYSNISATQQEDALRYSAFDLGIAGPDDTYGYGRLDLLAAFQWLENPPPTPTLQPTSTSTDTPTITTTPPTPTLQPTSTGTPTDTPTNTTTPPTPTDTATFTPVPDTATPSPTATASITLSPTVTASITPLPTFTATTAPLPTLTATSFINPVPVVPQIKRVVKPRGALHIGDLDRRSIRTSPKTWKAVLLITVHDAQEKPVSGVKLYIQWGYGAGGTEICTTNSKGICVISRSKLDAGTSILRLTVTWLSEPGYTYSSTRNHDPDGDSNGFTMLVARPAIFNAINPNAR